MTDGRNDRKSSLLQNQTSQHSSHSSTEPPLLNSSVQHFGKVSVSSNKTNANIASVSMSMQGKRSKECKDQNVSRLYRTNHHVIMSCNSSISISNSLLKLNQNDKPLKKRTRLCNGIHFKNDLHTIDQTTSAQNINDKNKLQQQIDSNVANSKEKSVKNKTDKCTKSKSKVSSFTCKTCTSSFKTRNDYRQHLRSHVGSFKCNVCSKMMKTKDSLYQHQKGLHSKEKPYSCKECVASFSFYHSYKLHLIKHRGERPHKCKYCEKSYLTICHLKDHMQAIHSKLHIVCHICGKKFSYPSTLRLHLHRHSGERPHKCTLCPKTFATRYALKIHADSHVSSRSFQCETCGKCFKSENLRNVHAKKHKSALRRLICDLCGKTFVYKCLLESHMQTHSKKRLYNCNICDKPFKTKASLYSHKHNVHREGPMFSCSICGKSFKTKSCLTVHSYRHCNEVHTCQICSSTFPDKGGLSKHMRTVHTPKKCFVCKICGKAGTRSDNMRIHVKTHKNKVSASCNLMDFIEEEMSTDQLQSNNSRNRSVGGLSSRSKLLYRCHNSETKHQNLQNFVGAAAETSVSNPDPNQNQVMDFIQEDMDTTNQVHNHNLNNSETLTLELGEKQKRYNKPPKRKNFQKLCGPEILLSDDYLKWMHPPLPVIPPSKTYYDLNKLKAKPFGLHPHNSSSSILSSLSSYSSSMPSSVSSSQSQQSQRSTSTNLDLRSIIIDDQPVETAAVNLQMSQSQQFKMFPVETQTPIVHYTQASHSHSYAHSPSHTQQFKTFFSHDQNLSKSCQFVNFYCQPEYSTASINSNTSSNSNRPTVSVTTSHNANFTNNPIVPTFSLSPMPIMSTINTCQEIEVSPSYSYPFFFGHNHDHQNPHLYHPPPPHHHHRSYHQLGAYSLPPPPPDPSIPRVVESSPEGTLIHEVDSLKIMTSL